MDSSVSPKDEIWFLRVCHHISNAVYRRPPYPPTWKPGQIPNRWRSLTFYLTCKLKAFSVFLQLFGGGGGGGLVDSAVRIYARSNRPSPLRQAGHPRQINYGEVKWSAQEAHTESIFTLISRFIRTRSSKWKRLHTYLKQKRERERHVSFVHYTTDMRRNTEWAWKTLWPACMKGTSVKHSLYQCFSTAGPRPGTGPWHQLYRAARGSAGIFHFSFLSIFRE